MAKTLYFAIFCVASLSAASALMCYHVDSSDPTQAPVIKDCGFDVNRCAITTVQVQGNTFSMPQCGLEPYNLLKVGCQKPPGVPGELCLCDTDECNKPNKNAASGFEVAPVAMVASLVLARIFA